jgi:hypothetical protein
MPGRGTLPWEGRLKAGLLVTLVREEERKWGDALYGQGAAKSQARGQSQDGSHVAAAQSWELLAGGRPGRFRQSMPKALRPQWQFYCGRDPACIGWRVYDA